MRRYRVLWLMLVVMSGVQTPPADAARPISARIVHTNGRPEIQINGSREYPFMYALTDVPGGRWSWEELPNHNIAQFASHGIRLFQVDLSFDHVWREDGSVDITLARKQIAGITRVAPDAAVVVRLHVTAPKWWMRRHPDEWVKYADTGYIDETDEGFPRIIEDDNNPVRRVSMASMLWRREAGEILTTFLRKLARTPEGNSLAGVQVANGIYGEWHNWGFYKNEPDTSRRMQEAFRTWLVQRYGDQAALRRAWNDSAASFSSVRVPGMEDRRTRHGIFRDPASERPVIDYYRCVHQLVADNIVNFARIVKQTWPRPIITGTFYGYFFSVFGRQAAGGHLELVRVLDSPHIDYLSGPQAYEPESWKPGDPYRSRSLITTIRLHGKLWLDELDVEPTIPLPRDGRYALVLQNGIANVRRNIAYTFTKGMGLWFYDFGVGGVDTDGYRHNARGSRGSWDHPAVMSDIGAARNLFAERTKQPYHSGADVLFVFDTESFYWTASLTRSDPVSNTLVDYAPLAAFRSGVVFDPIHVCDIEKVDLSPYRVVVFANTFVLSERQREYIRKRVAADNRTIVWHYAPGYSDGTKLDYGHISELVGMTITPASLRGTPYIVLESSADSTIGFSTGDRPFGPLFAVADSSAEVFGRYRETREVAIARKRHAEHTSWFIALPGKDPEPLRSILRKSGAHVYASRGEIVYAGNGVVVIHMKEGGRHSVALRNGKIVDLELTEGSHTLYLDAESGELLLPERRSATR